MTRRAYRPQVSTPRAEKHPSRWCRSLVVLLLAGSAFAARLVAAEEPPSAGPTAAPEAVAPAAPEAAPSTGVLSAEAANAGAPVVPVTPAFVIEKVVVEGVRYGSGAIVEAETLLKAGQAYTEKQLQQALHRVKRLPFVVEAAFALRKGTERGRFELVITVVETKPLFLGGALGVSGSGGTSARHWDVGLQPELGGRLFVRGQSEISLTLNGPTTLGDGTYSMPGFALRYAHHNLLGRHLVGSVSFGAATSVGQESGYHDRHGSADLALPVSRTSIVKAGISLHRSGNDLDYGLAPTREARRSYADAHLTWQSDTTDDPFTPRSGRKLAASVSYLRGHSDQMLSFWAFEPEKDEVLESDYRGPSASLSASRYWPLAGRLSLGIGGSLSAGQTQGEESLTQGGSVRQGSSRLRSAHGQLDLILLSTLPSRPGTACWWELRGALYGTGYENDILPWPDTPTSGRSSSAMVGLGVAYRGRWGIARLGVSYWHGLSNSYELR